MYTMLPFQESYYNLLGSAKKMRSFLRSNLLLSENPLHLSGLLSRALEKLLPVWQ